MIRPDDGNTGSRDEIVPTEPRAAAQLVILTLSSFVVTLNAASLPLPLPSILRDLGGTFDKATWVFASFILAFAVFLIPAARLADTYGRRLVVTVGATTFSVASLAATLAPSLSVLIGALAGQGIGAAMIMPSIHALISATFPPEEQERAFNLQTGGVFAGAALGPILSGLLTTILSWRYIFVLNVAIGFVVLAGVIVLVPESRAEYVPSGLNLFGLLLGAAGIFSLIFPVVEGARFGWGSPLIVSSIVASIVLLPLFVGNEMRSRNPLVDLSLFRNRLFSVGAVVRGTTEFASLGLFFALSHFLQVQLGYSALVAGSLLMSIILGALVISPLAESSTGRRHVRALVILGFLLVALGSFWLAHVSPGTKWTFFIAPLAITGLGFGVLESPTEATMQAAVPSSQSETAWRVSYSAYLLGIGLGVAVVSGVLQTQAVANVNAAISGTDVSRLTADRILASVHSGGLIGPGLTGFQDLIHMAIADAVNTSLLSCVAVALLGTVFAIFFSAGREPRAAREVVERGVPSDILEVDHAGSAKPQERHHS